MLGFFRLQHRLGYFVFVLLSRSQVVEKDFPLGGDKSMKPETIEGSVLAIPFHAPTTLQRCLLTHLQAGMGSESMIKYRLVFC